MLISSVGSTGRPVPPLAFAFVVAIVLAIHTNHWFALPVKPVAKRARAKHGGKCDVGKDSGIG